MIKFCVWKAVQYFGHRFIISFCYYDISDFFIISLYFEYKPFVQSGEWLRLKILEIQPELMKLGGTTREATELLNAHDQLLLRLQVKLNLIFML